jgi:hypothetical protein
LQKFPPDLILVAPTSEVYPLLVSAPDWRQVYRDAGAALFQPQKEKSALSVNDRP